MPFPKERLINMNLVESYWTEERLRELYERYFKNNNDKNKKYFVRKLIISTLSKI